MRLEAEIEQLDMNIEMLEAKKKEVTRRKMEMEQLGECCVRNFGTFLPDGRHRVPS